MNNNVIITETQAGMFHVFFPNGRRSFYAMLDDAFSVGNKWVKRNKVKYPNAEVVMAKNKYLSY